MLEKMHKMRVRRYMTLAMKWLEKEGNEQGNASKRRQPNFAKDIARGMKFSRMTEEKQEACIQRMVKRSMEQTRKMRELIQEDKQPSNIKKRHAARGYYIKEPHSIDQAIFHQKLYDKYSYIFYHSCALM